MSIIDDFKTEFVESIRKMSQAEGMHDQEIADYLGCSRATINRVRKSYSIPTALLKNRKDKSYTCLNCNKEYIIRRKERRKKLCPDCLEQCV